MGDKIVLVGRKLGLSGRKLVTTAGGAPCCCGGGIVCGTSCSQANCLDCLIDEHPVVQFYPRTVITGAGNLAAMRTALEDVFGNFDCAVCGTSGRTKVQLNAWSFTALDPFNSSVSAVIPAVTLCESSDTFWWYQQSGLVNPLSYSWMHPEYGFRYSQQGSDYNAVSDYVFNQPGRCEWEAGSGDGYRSTIPPDVVSQFLITYRSATHADGDDGPVTFTEQATSVTVVAKLARVLETQRTIPTGLGGHEYLGGVCMIVEYQITTPSGFVIIIPSPSGNAQDPGISGIVDIEEWGGWVSCRGLRVINFGGGSWGITAFNQSDKGCNAPRVCGTFSPMGVTVLTPFEVEDPTRPGEAFNVNYFSWVWPNPSFPWQTYSNSGFEAVIEDEYGASCADDPPDAGLLGLV